MLISPAPLWCSMKGLAVLGIYLLVSTVELTIENADADWATWVQTYNKHYKSDAVKRERYAIWKSNRAAIAEHNKVADILGYTLGMNAYADLKTDEFAKLFNGYEVPPNFAESATFGGVEDRQFDLPHEVNWNASGAVTEVKNQGRCPACWAFSATGALEGQHFIKTKKLVSLSEQNLIDCSKKDGNNGCGSGYMTTAFACIKRKGGIDTEKSYPFTGKTGAFCLFNQSSIGATLSGYKTIPRGNVTALMQAVATIGPISAGMDGSLTSFKMYKQGVYSDKDCSSTNLHHAVLVVGYGTHNGTDYFLVKNSYGTSWGMEGFAMIKRDSSNLCGLATAASYPVL